MAKTHDAFWSAALIQESVCGLTGWSLCLTGLRVEEVKGKQLEECAAFDELRRTGVPTRRLKGRPRLACYLPSENVILCNSDLLSQVSENEACKHLFLAVVRAAQCQMYPDFFLSVDHLLREALLMGRHGGDVPVDERVRRRMVAQDKLQARLGFVDGHASVLYAGFAQQEGMSFSLLEPSIEAALHLFEGSASRLSQYLSGALVVNEVFSRYPEMIDTLYSTPALVEQAFGVAQPSAPEQERIFVDSVRPAL